MEQWLCSRTHSYCLFPSPFPISNCHPSPKANEFWRGIDADLNNPSRWVCFYLQENDRVPEWWREFQLLIHSLDKSFSDVQVQKNGLPASHGLQAASCTIGMRWLMDHLTLPRVTTAKGLPSPSRLQRSLGLSSVVC